jgi:hypothetical protein
VTALVSAQVILNKNVELLEHILEQFEMLGFECGPVIANSFSITASQSCFEQAFAVHLEQRHQQFTLEHGELEFPLEHLSEEVRLNVQAVVFTKPPDFGPSHF